MLLVTLIFNLLTVVMAAMSFDPPPTAEQASRNSGRHFPSSSARRSPSQEPPPYTTDDILAAKYQKKLKLISAIRTATSAITLAISIAIVACAGNSLRAYSSTHMSGSWWLPLWPTHVDLRPTHSALACGIVVMISSLIYLIAAFFPSVCLYTDFNSLLLLIASHPATTEISPSQHHIHHSCLDWALHHPLHNHLRRHHQLAPFGQHRLRHTHVLDLQVAGLPEHSAG